MCTQVHILKSPLLLECLPKHKGFLENLRGERRKSWSSKNNKRETKYLREFSSNTRTLFSFFSFFLAAILKNTHWKVYLSIAGACTWSEWVIPKSFSGLFRVVPSLSKQEERETQIKMAEIPDKNVNILSRFTKLPDKNQATVLVSLEIILS